MNSGELASEEEEEEKGEREGRRRRSSLMMSSFAACFLAKFPSSFGQIFLPFWPKRRGKIEINKMIPIWSAQCREEGKSWRAQRLPKVALGCLRLAKVGKENNTHAQKELSSRHGLV